MRVLVTGSRGWHDESAVERAITQCQQIAKSAGEEFVLIHGHSKNGADALADRVGLRLGLVPGKDLLRVPAAWKRYGRAAGPIRNQQMLDEHQPDVVLAFRATGKSNGTDDMIERARKAEVETHVFHPLKECANVRYGNGTERQA